jgi:4-amino-4-deoxy-L-arabinose transferase-like glycosyltransferase
MPAPGAADTLQRLKFWRPPSPDAALPPASATEELVGAAVGLGATLWVFLVALWGVNGPFPDGHFASQANAGVIGLNMSRYHTIFAYWPFLEQPPGMGSAYMHHPLGLFWTAGLMIKLFGAHDWALRAPAIICVALTAFFEYRCGRAIWGPIAGALCALAYAALPITLGFANFLALEQWLMLGTLIATWGYVRFRQTGFDRYTLASVAGLAIAVLYDWEAYVWVGLLLAFLFVRGFVIPARWLGAVDGRRFGRYWAVMAGAAIVLLAFTVGLVLYSGRVEDLIGVYGVRSAGRATPLHQVLQARHVRIELMFTALGIALGKLAVPVIIGRFVVRRDEFEALPLFLLIMALLQYLLFKQGADVHIFWPHPFATYFGLAVGALAATARDLWVWAAPRLRRRFPGARLPGAERAALVGGALVLLPVLLVLRDGASLIRLARESGGRFMEVGGQSEIDEDTALRWFLARFPESERVGYHVSVAKHWNVQWAARPRQDVWQQPVAPPQPRIFMMDARNGSAADLREAARRYHVHAVGWFWLMDRGAPPAPIDGYSFDEHDPGPLESLSQGATEPIRRVVPDPFVTWEWRTLMGQPATQPPANPATRDQLRIAHNAAVVRGDAAAAARYRADLVSRLDIPVTAKWNTGLELLGVAHHRGAARSLTPFFLEGKTGACQKVLIRAHVTGRRFLSTLPVDPDTPDTAPLPPVLCDLWQAGQIYSVPTVYRHRAGHESFVLSLGPYERFPAPARLGGTGPITLLAD